MICRKSPQLSLLIEFTHCQSGRPFRVTEPFPLIKLSEKPSISFVQLTLSGWTPDNFKIESKTIYLLEWALHSLTSVDLKLSCGEITVSSPDIDQKLPNIQSVRLRYELIGFRCKGIIKGETELGKIKATGNTNIKNYDNITGALTIEKESINNAEEWVQLSEEKVDLILDVFSLAGGRYIEWARKSLWVEDQMIKCSGHES